ncbi:MAG: phenylalanine--tRNA ligase subunit alpha [SAR202 cluster bacterium]|nr:phenylalanine--tRNA ligase subunit alpha [SAR202 cluster bacterium]
MDNIPDINNINDTYEKALGELKDNKTERDLSTWRTKYLGRKGILTGLLRNLKSTPIDSRREIGQQLNNIKNLLENNYEEAVNAAGKSDHNNSSVNYVDITMPGRPIQNGRLHPTTQIIREVCEAFLSMGFDVAEGPEVEWEYYNFDALNIPADHPARDMWDTLWVESDKQEKGNILLRTHTSPMQARIMENREPPVRVVVPGKVFRYEASDATHEWHFYQVEGLAVDQGLTFADLKGTLFEFAKRIFGENRKIRFRCDYFPFVEPGVDMSIDCFACSDSGLVATENCSICKRTGWIEIMGAGMVHPRVLEQAGYDPNKYTGFAFGLGPERIAMLKYGIDDIRHFYSNDIRFLNQF